MREEMFGPETLEPAVKERFVADYTDGTDRYTVPYHGRTFSCALSPQQLDGYVLACADIARELLRLYDDRAALDARLAAQRTRLEALAADTAQKLRLLDTARERLRKEADMNYNVTIKTLPARYAACVRMTIPCYEAEGMVWDVLCRETDHMPLVPDDPCYCSVTFLDEEYKERDVLIEASKTVRGRYPDTEHVRFQTLPPVTYAGCVFRGSYAQISDVIAAVAAWVTANGYESAGPMFDIYHVSPHETQNPDEFVTEVCFPVREA